MTTLDLILLFWSLVGVITSYFVYKDIIEPDDIL